MTEKPRPARAKKTSAPGYFFGAMKAADAMHAKRGKTRETAKLPTSLAELHRCSAKRDDLGYRCADCRASWVGQTEPPACVRPS